MGYTVKDVKSIIENLNDDTPLFGFILGPKDQEVEPEGEESREATWEEWAKIVDYAENLASGGNGMTWWDGQWDMLNEAIGAVINPEGGEDD